MTFGLNGIRLLHYLLNGVFSQGMQFMSEGKEAVYSFSIANVMEESNEVKNHPE